MDNLYTVHDVYGITEIISTEGVFRKMVIWLVKARPRVEKLRELRARLDSGEISAMRPFGESLDEGLRNARIRQEDGYALWEEEDYCRPPLAQEREAVLDSYFDELSVVDARQPGMGWKRVEKLPSLWSNVKRSTADQRATR